MKKSHLALTLLMILASCVHPQGALTPTEAYEIRSFVPNADLSDLTPAQVSALSRVLHDGDGLDTAYRIRSILLPRGPKG